MAIASVGLCRGRGTWGKAAIAPVTLVIPAQAGIQLLHRVKDDHLGIAARLDWIPAFAGMTWEIAAIGRLLP